MSDLVGRKGHYELDHRKYHFEIMEKISASTFLVRIDKDEKLMTLADMRALQFIFAE